LAHQIGTPRVIPPEQLDVKFVKGMTKIFNSLVFLFQ